VTKLEGHLFFRTVKTLRTKSENSPAFQGWENDDNETESRQGRKNGSFVPDGLTSGMSLKTQR